MLKYSNGFSIAADSERETLLVSMLQNYPDVDSTGALMDDMKTDVIDTFVFDRGLAENLAMAMLDIVNKDNENSVDNIQDSDDND